MYRRYRINMVSKKNTLHAIYSLTNNITNFIDKHDKIAAVFVAIKMILIQLTIKYYSLNYINIE